MGPAWDFELPTVGFYGIRIWNEDGQMNKQKN